MSLVKRGKIWWIDISGPTGDRIRRTTGTDKKELAQEYHDRLKADLWKQSKLKEKPSHTWDEAAARWLSARADRSNAKNNVAYIEWLSHHLSGHALSSIDLDTVDRLADLKAKEKRTGHNHKGPGLSVSPSTVNRYLACLRSILRSAWEWGWIESPPPVSLMKTPNKRIRFLSPGEIEKLLSELPPHMRSIVSFALATGIRQKNILDLEWNQIDLDRKTLWIHADQAKGGKNLRIPLSPPAVNILESERGKHVKRVFTYNGRPMETVGQSFDRAVRKAGLENFCFHDLRHTWASLHVQNGTPLAVLQELGGWASLQMVMRYAHLAEHHLSEWASNTGEVFKNRGTNTAQSDM